MKTVSKQQSYPLPSDLNPFTSLKVRTGKGDDILEWQPLALTKGKFKKLTDEEGEIKCFSDVPTFFNVRNGMLRIWPTPLTSGNEIIIIK